MIVRISGEGQYRLADDLHGPVNDLDDAVVAAVDADDEAAFTTTFAALLDFVRTKGEPLADDELVSSQILIPPADTTLAEAEADFTGEGLIPDPA
jgi:hypothetical protein